MITGNSILGSTTAATANTSTTATTTGGGLNRRKSEFNSSVLLVPVFTVTSAVQTKKDHLSNMKEIYDGLKCAKTR